MSKEFNCPSCSAPMSYEGGDSIFQTCKSCLAPIIVPSEFLYKKDEQLASENFASLVNDKPVDVEQVTNELTPGGKLPRSKDVIDPEARIEKFEVYQEKIGTSSVETKKAVDAIITPKKDEGFKVGSPYVSPFENEKDDEILETPSENVEEETADNPIISRVKYHLENRSKIEAIKVFRERFKTGLREAKNAVEALERGEQIDVSRFQK